jgi:alanine dehydrogenase
MIVGAPKETKNDEFRVGLTPSSVVELVRHGHRVLVERGAGIGSGLTDANYRDAGAEIVDTDRVFSEPALIVKVKEPQRDDEGV